MRYGRKCLAGNPGSLSWRESSRDYSCNCFIYILRGIVGYVLDYSKRLWLFIILGCKWKENKPFISKREDKGKARNTWIFRFVIAMSGLRNLQLRNIWKRLAYYLSTLGRHFRRENALGHIYARWRTCGLHAIVIYIYIYIYIRQFLNLMINSRAFVKIYIYIYMLPVIFGYPANGHRTLGLS